MTVLVRHGPCTRVLKGCGELETRGCSKAYFYSLRFRLVHVLANEEATWGSLLDEDRNTSAADHVAMYGAVLCVCR